MTFRFRAVLVVLAAGLAAPAMAEDAAFAFGGDQYLAAQNAAITAPVARDAFVAGYDVRLGAPVGGDAHLAGYSVSADAEVTGNVYAAGYAVSVGAPVGSDLMAGGNTVSVSAPVAGNLRLAGETITVSAPTGGSALISARTLTLDATIAGDLSFYGETIAFAPGAVVTGRVLIHAPQEIAVPASVAPADRVTYTALAVPDYMSEAGRTAQHVVRGFWPEFWAAAVWWLALVVVGAAFIAFMPRGVAAIEAASVRRPLALLGSGVVAFAAVLGLVPVVAITVIGLVLLPFVLVFVAIACALAFIAGAYALGVLLARRFFGVETNLRRVVVLAAALLVTALLGLIPFLGWLLTLGVLVFGFGTIARWRRDRIPSAAPGPLAAGPIG